MPAHPTSRSLRLAPLLVWLLLLVLWTLVTSFPFREGDRPFLDPIILPTPTAVFGAAWRLLLGGGIWPDIGATSGRLGMALLGGILAGVPLGLWLGYHRGIYRACEGFLHALRSIPSAALFPLFLIVVGVGEQSIITLAFYNSATVILISTVAGALIANESRLRQGADLGMKGFDIVRRILFWEALPHIFSGVRVALGYSLALVIAIEMFIGVSSVGLGRKIFEYQAAYRIPETYASIAITSALGILLNILLTKLETRMLHWLPGARR